MGPTDMDVGRPLAVLLSKLLALHVSGWDTLGFSGYMVSVALNTTLMQWLESRWGPRKLQGLGKILVVIMVMAILA